MPKEEKDIVDKSIDAKTFSEEHASKSKNNSDIQVMRRLSTPLMIVLLVVAGLLFIATIASVTGNMFIRNHSGFMFGRNNNSNTLFVQPNNGYRMRSSGGMMGLRNFDNDSTTNTNVVSGVVTSVNGSSFVIAGGGNQYTVNTTGSTTYNTTDKKVIVNDSVIISGTITDKTIAASDVRIINY